MMASFQSTDSTDDLSGSNRMIQNQMQLAREVHSIAQRLDEIESGQQSQTKNQEYIIRTLNQILKTLNVKKPQTKKPPAQRQHSSACKTLSASDISRLLHLPQALQKNICKFTENVVFNPTNIPDELIECECLSEDECSAIASKPSYKDQIRMLIRKIKTRGPQKIEKFLEIVGKDHPQVQKDVIESLQSIVSESKTKPVCAICVMKSAVDLKDVGDDLWRAEIISDDIYGDIMDCESIHLNRSILWENIIYSINNFDDPENALDILISALESKYKYIVDYLRETPQRPSLNCSCCRKRRIRARPLWSDFGSQSDLSTTSEVPRRKLPKTIYMRDENLSDNEIQSITSSQDLLSGSFRGLSYDVLERYDSIGNNSDRVFSQSLEIQNPTVSSTTNDVIERNDENRNRHFSGNFIPQEPSTDTGDCNRSIPFFFPPSNNAYGTYTEWPSQNLFGKNAERPSQIGDEPLTKIIDDGPVRPGFLHSLSMQSNITMVGNGSLASDVATHSSSSYDGNQVQRSSSDGLVSPGVTKEAVSFPKEAVDVQQVSDSDTNKESAKESDDEEPLFVRQKAYRRRRLRSSADVVDVDDQVDNKRASHFDRARQRRVQRKQFARQKSLPKGDKNLTTNPLSQPDNAKVNPESRTSKQILKHELRRQQSTGKIGTNDECISTDADKAEEKDSQKLFSPIQNKDMQLKSLSKSDHNQAKHFLQTSQHSTTFARDKSFKSDTDLGPENLSDILAYSDFTT